MKTVFPLNQLIYPPPWTLGEKTQPANLVVNPVLSPPPLPSYDVRPLVFKNRLKQVKVFCHGETYSSLQSWNIISYFQGQRGVCARKIKYTDLNCFLNKRAKSPKQYYKIQQFSLLQLYLELPQERTQAQNLFSWILLSSENSLLN